MSRPGTQWGAEGRVRRVRDLLAAMVGAAGVGMLMAGSAVSLPPTNWVATESLSPLSVSVSPDWVRVAAFGGRGETPRAVDRSASGQLAVADEAGVTWWRGEIRERAQIDGVRDLAFDAAGKLWVGASSGLYVWSLAGRPIRRDLRGGEAANRIRRLAVNGRSLLVASEQGAFWSTEGQIFQPLEGVAANDDYTLAAFRVEALPNQKGAAPVPRVEAWLFGVRGLVRIRGMQTPSGLRVLGTDRVALPRPTRESSARDISISADGQTLWAAYADALAARSLAPPGRDELDRERWMWLRPVLPPGAEIRRVVMGRATTLLATDSGLLESRRGEPAFRRVSSSAGTSNCVDVREVGPVAVALCREGVFEKDARPAQNGRAAAPIAEALPQPRLGKAKSLPEDPLLPEIRRRALKRLGLSIGAADGMRRGLARRAIFPEVALRFGVDVDRDRARDADQAFISGDTRHLLDRSRDEGLGLNATIEFEWDLGGLVYPEDSVDLSRELRQLISLRDDVADEINQLYFERQRIRSRLIRVQSKSAEETAALDWRAREIDAGLDAWTGGWIAEWRRSRQAKEEASGNDHPVPKRGTKK